MYENRDGRDLEMFYLYFLLQLFLLALLSPVRWGLNTIVRFAWKPAFQFKAEVFKDADISLLEKKANEFHK
ncbi:hypothetical protein, partial [Persephonella sp.]|uniref:hypothetical protein n=1 Tax=Persephonella sp. TaxID=2060922 RepID=UPI002631B51A